MTPLRKFPYPSSPTSLRSWYWASFCKYISPKKNTTSISILLLLKTASTTLIDSHPPFYSFLRRLREGKGKCSNKLLYACVNLCRKRMMESQRFVGYFGFSMALLQLIWWSSSRQSVGIFLFSLRFLIKLGKVFNIDFLVRRASFHLWNHSCNGRGQEFRCAGLLPGTKLVYLGAKQELSYTQNLL